MARVATLLSLAMLAALASAVFAAPASAEVHFVVTGRGRGHGMGLMQEGARGYAVRGYKWDWILRHYYQKTTLGTLKGNPVVRAALDVENTSRASWTLRATNGSLVVSGDRTKAVKLPAGNYYTFVPGKVGVSVFKDVAHDGYFQSGTDTWVLNVVGRAFATAQSTVPVVQVHSASGPFGRSDVLWRGTVRIVQSGSRVFAYDDVVMEDYLKGVVPRESPEGWGAPSVGAYEELKAQAVASRGYAFRSLVPSRNFDVYCDTKSQMYNGYGRLTGSSVELAEGTYTNKAIASTASRVVIYVSPTTGRATVVQTFFDSLSGGRTENNSCVWGGEQLPYLTSVIDPYERPSAAGRVWPATVYSASDLRARLVYRGVPVPATLTDVVVTSRGPGGRVTSILLRGASGRDNKSLGLSYMNRFRQAVGGKDRWIYITKSSIGGPLVAQAGVRVPIKVIVSPAQTGYVSVAYGPRGASSLNGRVKVRIVKGVGYGWLPGLSGPTEMAVWSGSQGSGSLFQSLRSRIAVCRRSSVKATASGRSLTMTGSVRPSKTGLPVSFYVRAPKAGSPWQKAGSAPLTAAGSAVFTWKATSAGTWSVRISTPASDAFVAGTSAAATVVAR